MQHDETCLNPYESPRGVEGSIIADEPWLKVYEPAVMPRDSVDVFLGTTLGILASVVVFGVPLGGLYWFQAPELYSWIAIGIVLALATLAMLAAIRQIELTADQIIVRRVLLPTLRLPWSAVTSIRTAGRLEAFFAAVVFPHRCCSYTFTSRDQICIEAGSWKLLFPAKEADAFRTTTRLLAVRHNPDFAE